MTEYEHSWNKKACVLYVEQPSGVGLSWSADQAHHSTNDEQASADNLLFLKAFFQVFASYKTSPFYVTGESCAYTSNLPLVFWIAGSWSSLTGRSSALASSTIRRLRGRSTCRASSVRAHAVLTQFSTF